jgi:hypothetical protein
MRFLLELAWRDLQASGRRLWIFCACLVLGVALVAAGGGLYRQVADALLSDARQMFGGDVQVESPDPLPLEAQRWMADRGQVSRTIELRTMLRTEAEAARWRDDFAVAFPTLTAEVRSFDERSDRMAEVLGQMASGLLLIGFSALFIGGLGVYNSV